MNAFITKIVELPRWQKRIFLFAFDSVILFISLWLSYSLRLGVFFQPNSNQLILMAAAPVIAIPLLWWFGVYHTVVRYLTEKTFWSIVKAMTVAVLFWLGLAFMTRSTGVSGVPRTIPVLFGIIGTALIIGSRFAARAVFHSAVEAAVGKTNTIIFGAGTLGRQLAAALLLERRTKIVAFLDDDPNLRNTEMAGARVYPKEHLASLLAAHNVQELIVCADAADGAARAKVLSIVAGTHVRVRFLAENSGSIGESLLQNLREIGIPDLLGRPLVKPDPELLRGSVAGKCVLVTGAGGSIGSELARQIVKLEPAQLVLLDQDETALYDIHRTVGVAREPAVVPVLASVLDHRALDRLFATHQFDTVYHAAAYKHVPLSEANPLVAITNNVFGTWHVTQAARRHGVERFVLISTDKAVRPSNIMGASKRWAEIIVRNSGGDCSKDGGKQHFCCVRFGNVIGSQGSVVPLFQEQIKNGGPVTLTDERMTRYFMSINEASELIIQAASLSEGGEVFLLDMGEPVRIKDLAYTMVRLSGLSVRSEDNPAGDIEIAVVGPRPGEKLYEELFYDVSSAKRTVHPKIVVGARRHRDPDEVKSAVVALEQYLAEGDAAGARQLLFSFIKEAPNYDDRAVQSGTN